MNFSFHLTTKIYFGRECFNELLSLLRIHRYSKIGIVVDCNLINLPITQELLSRCREISETVLGIVTVAEPTYHYLEEIRQPFMGSDIQVIIGVGGGSTLDVAKAIAVLVNNRDKAIAYRGFDKMTEPVLPVIAVPTTAGTGSEVTPNASFVDDEIQKKLGINGEAIRPQHAFLNPEMLLSCPEKPAISAGIDALVHAVEAFAARKATYVSKIFSREAIGLIVNNLERSVFDKEIEAIENVFLGSLFAGIAMMHSGTGPAAAFSYPLGVRKKVPHGFAGGVFLPIMMDWNVRNGYYGYGDLAPSICKQELLSSPEKNARCVVDRFKKLWKRLNIPTDLKAYNFDTVDIDLFINDILELKAALEQNPILIGKDDIKRLLEELA